MQIDDALITYLENLSCLALSDDEKERLAGDLREILDGISTLGGLDTENIPERSHPFDDTNAFRDDVLSPSAERDRILRNAPRKNDRMFIAPKTVG